METEGQPKRTEPVLFLIALTVIFSLTNYFVGLDEDFEIRWGYYLVISGALAGFLIGLILNSYGLVFEFRKKATGSFLLIQMLIPFLSTIWFETGLTMEDALSNAFTVFIAVGFSVVAVEASGIAYGILRTVKGFRNCARIEQGAVVAVIPDDDVTKFGTKIIDRKVKYELEGAISYETSVDTFVWKNQAKSGYEILQLDSLIVFYKLENKLLRVLFVPKDGIVCKFNKSADVVNDFKYAVTKALHLRELGTKESEVAVEDLRRVFEEYASATYVRGSLRSCLCLFSREFWLKKKWRLPGAVLIMTSIGCVVYWDSLVSWMSDEGNMNAVFTLAGIAGIIATIVTPIIMVVLGRKQLPR